MHSGDIQIALIAEAKRLGKQPDELTALEVSAVAVSHMTPMEAVSNGIKAIGSLVATRTGARSVPLHIYEARKGEAGCGGCPKMGKTPSGGIYCKSCGCSGVFMEAALRDPNESCRLPKGQKRWEKYVEPS